MFVNRWVKNLKSIISITIHNVETQVAFNFSLDAPLIFEISHVLTWITNEERSFWVDMQVT